MGQRWRSTPLISGVWVDRDGKGLMWMSWKHQYLPVLAPPTPSTSSMDGPRCTQGHLVRPSRHQEEEPPTACCSSRVDPNKLGGVQIRSGQGQNTPPCFGQPSGLPAVPSRASRPLPPMSSTGPAAQATGAREYPRN